MKSQTFFYFGIITLISCLIANKVSSQAINYFQDQRDGNYYNYVQIGNQIWMTENLKFKSKNGSACYENDEKNCNIYGRLYTWEAAKKACPSGWHLPSKDEWEILFNNLGGKRIASGKMKERGTSHWKSPNGEATNSSGFNALPGGHYTYKEFSDLGEYAYFLSSTAKWSKDYNNNPIDYEGQGYNLRYHHGEVETTIIHPASENKYSIRCIKNIK